MAGFIMQVQSAILPFVCTLETGQHLYYLSETIIHAGLARLPVVNPMGEPNTQCI